MEKEGKRYERAKERCIQGRMEQMNDKKLPFFFPDVLFVRNALKVKSVEKLTFPSPVLVFIAARVNLVLGHFMLPIFRSCYSSLPSASFAHKHAHAHTHIHKKKK